MTLDKYAVQASGEYHGIRLALEPRVYLLAQTQFVGSGALEYFVKEQANGWIEAGENGFGADPDEAEGGEAVVEFAGRVCYNSFGKRQGTVGNGKYLANIRERKHGSVLEHASFTLLIADVSRALTHELVRHRHLSFSQQSSRYVEPERAVVVPPQLLEMDGLLGLDMLREWVRAQAEQLAMQVDARAATLVVAANAAAQGDHAELTRHAVRAERMRASEIGRSLMPHAAVTRLVATGNARSWRHFLHLRGSQYAEPEIRRLATVVADVLCRAAPALFADVTVADGLVLVDDGTF